MLRQFGAIFVSLPSTILALLLAVHANKFITSSSIPPPASALAYSKPSGPRALLIVRHHSGTSSTAEYPKRV